MTKHIKLKAWEVPKQVTVDVDPFVFLQQLKDTMIGRQYDGISDNGDIYYEHSYCGSYVVMGKATPKQIAIHNAVGELWQALCMEN